MALRMRGVGRVTVSLRRSTNPEGTGSDRNGAGSHQDRPGGATGGTTKATVVCRLTVDWVT
jgi:hypothetical protein